MTPSLSSRARTGCSSTRMASIWAEKRSQRPASEAGTIRPSTLDRGSPPRESITIIWHEEQSYIDLIQFVVVSYWNNVQLRKAKINNI